LLPNVVVVVVLDWVKMTKNVEANPIEIKRATIKQPIRYKNERE
jgi:hypothetical protein